jgi:acyl-CoA thioesterase
MNAMTPQQVAEAARDAMWKDDRASQALGMTIAAVGPGSATVTMTVRPDMLNGFDICHGGLIATLADTAFAFACNAYNELTVAAGFDVNIVAAARGGDLLTARATEVSRTGRTGVYDIAVTNRAATRWRCFAAARSR